MAATVFVDYFHSVSVMSEAGALTVQVVGGPAVELADDEPETVLQAEPVVVGPAIKIHRIIIVHTCVMSEAGTLTVQVVKGPTV